MNLNYDQSVCLCKIVHNLYFGVVWTEFLTKYLIHHRYVFCSATTFMVVDLPQEHKKIIVTV